MQIGDRFSLEYPEQKRHWKEYAPGDVPAAAVFPVLSGYHPRSAAEGKEHNGRISFLFFQDRPTPCSGNTMVRVQ